MVNNMNANSDHTLPRLQERRNEKLNTTGLIRKITFGNIKLNEAKASIKSNEVRPSIKQDKVRVRGDVRAKTRDGHIPARESTHVPRQEMTYVSARESKNAPPHTRDNVRDHTGFNVQADQSDWDPGGGSVKPCDLCLVA